MVGGKGAQIERQGCGGVTVKNVITLKSIFAGKFGHRGKKKRRERERQNGDIAKREIHKNKTIK